MMKKRIVSIDVLRGFALLGILLMNMASFAMPNMAYFNPTVYGGDDLLNRLVFNLSHIFADQKMMALFSMLFGASVMLVTNNLEKNGKSPFWFHYIRNFWLLIIGLLHSILIWDGDILLIYAVCSFVLYWLRKLPAKWQFGLGLFIFFVPSLLNVVINTAVPHFRQADFQYLREYWQPDETAVANEIEFYQGAYAEQVTYRLTADFEDGSAITAGQELLELSQLVEFFARALGMMLLGMAFYTWGILTNKRTESFYINLALVGILAGVSLGLMSLFQYAAHGWQPGYSLFIGRIPNHIATPFMASGYIGLIMLWSRSTLFTNFRDKIAAVGRMALTNYIGQSVISTFIFYGFGLGLFGSLNRIQQFLIILLIWTLQIQFSAWWLSRYQYGPLELVWRMLSHRQWQPLRKKELVLEQI